MRTRIARYRRTDPSDRSDFEIGCRILTQPFFFDEADWISVPSSWSPNIVSFKTYNTSDGEGLALWETVNEHMIRMQAPGMAETGARFGEPHLIRPRLGQGASKPVSLAVSKCCPVYPRTADVRSAGQ
jgi:putative restriction endonuclease